MPNLRPPLHSLALLVRRLPRRITLLAIVLALGLYALAHVRQPTPSVPVKLARPLLTAHVRAAAAADAHPVGHGRSGLTSWWSKSSGRADWGRSVPAAEVETREDGSVIVRRRRRSLRQWVSGGAAAEARQQPEEVEEGHPIRRLMDDARVEWEMMLARQSTTLYVWVFSTSLHLLLSASC
jgi:hypothetical protein